MSDYRSVFFEMAAKALPSQFYVARSHCGGEAIIAAPNPHLARELACRIWREHGGEEPLPCEFDVEAVPLILCPENFVPHASYDAAGVMHVVGDSEYWGDTDTVRRAIETAREDRGPGA